jgi:hypothetical protein
MYTNYEAQELVWERRYEETETAMDEFRASVFSDYIQENWQYFFHAYLIITPNAYLGSGKRRIALPSATTPYTVFFNEIWGARAEHSFTFKVGKFGLVTIEAEELFEALCSDEDFFNFVTEGNEIFEEWVEEEKNEQLNRL